MFSDSYRRGLERAWSFQLLPWQRHTIFFSFWSLSPPSYNYVSMMFVPWQVSQTARRRPSSGRTFWLKTSNIFINSPLRFLFLLMLIKTKEHTRQRSETFPLGLFTVIVKKPLNLPWTTSRRRFDLGAHRKLRERKRQLLDIPAWPVRRNNFKGLAKFQSQQILREI